MKKDELRNLIKQKRQNMTEKEVKDKSRMLCDAIYKSDIYKKSDFIAIYMPLGNEADIGLIGKKAFSDGKRVCVPVTEKKDIYFSEILPNDEFILGRFGIKEPKTKRCTNAADTVLVPGLAFSAGGTRLGWGGGWYDRLLAKSNAVKVGIGYDFQISDESKAESHDIKMDFIFTESGLIVCE